LLSNVQQYRKSVTHSHIFFVPNCEFKYSVFISRHFKMNSTEFAYLES